MTTGSRDESDWEVTDGLQEGDEVIVGEVPAEDAPERGNGGRS